MHVQNRMSNRREVDQNKTYRQVDLREQFHQSCGDTSLDDSLDDEPLPLNDRSLWDESLEETLGERLAQLLNECSEECLEDTTTSNELFHASVKS